MSPRTWLAFSHHLAGLIVALAAFVFVVAGVSVGVTVIWVLLAGVPIIGLTLRGSRLLAQFERARFALLLGVRIAAWPAAARAGFRWGLVPRLRVLREGPPGGSLATRSAACPSAW